MNVVIIGASSSIGLATVKAFEAGGHRVVGTSRQDLDLTRLESIDRFGGEVGGDGVDALVVLAGVLPGKNLESYDVETMHRVMGVNFIGPALLTKVMLPKMREGSQILMMSSISAERGSYDPIYAASKAALIGFVKSLAAHLGPRVRANALAPGLIGDSSMYAVMHPDRKAYHHASAPTGRLTTVEEVAGIIAQICSPAWANVTGQVICV